MSHSSVVFLPHLLFLRVPFPYGPQVPVWKNAISSPAGACVGGASRQLSFFVREIAKSPILLTSDRCSNLQSSNAPGKGTVWTLGSIWAAWAPLHPRKSAYGIEGRRIEYNTVCLIQNSSCTTTSSVQRLSRRQNAHLLYVILRVIIVIVLSVRTLQRITTNFLNILCTLYTVYSRSWYTVHRI